MIWTANGARCGGAERCIPEGICQPIETPEECWSDSDCPEGMICELPVFEGEEVCVELDDGFRGMLWQFPIPAGSMKNGEVFCEEPPFAGVCVASNGPEPECYVDEDCPEGMICDFVDVYPEEGLHRAGRRYGRMLPAS